MAIIQNGDIFNFSNIPSIHKTLPKGVYMLQTSMEGIYLKKKEDFVLPKKIYGDHSIVDRWITSFKNNSEKNLGILLSGIKGTGKTITAQKFCIDIDLPIIIINAEYAGPAFIDFMTNPELGTAVVFIDEFEKIYQNKDKQRDLLSLMDGQYPTNLIFLLTANEEIRNDYLINRLNRIKYKKEYFNLEESVMAEVIDDLLVNKEHAESIYDFFNIINICTFDLLVNIIKEMNLFKEDAISCGKHLNLKSEDSYVNITEIYKGKSYECHSMNFRPGLYNQINRKKVDYLPEDERDTAVITIGFGEGNNEYTLEKVQGGKLLTVKTPIDVDYEWDEDAEGNDIQVATDVKKDTKIVEYKFLITPVTYRSIF